MKKNYFSRIFAILFVLVLFGTISSFAQNEYALSFDGNESFYVNDDASNNLDLTGSYTFECWFNLDSYQQYDRIFDRRTVCAMSIMAANGSGDFALRFTERGSSHNVLRTLETAAAYDMDLDTWYHVAMTYDVTTHDAKLYINGDLAASTNNSNWSLTASTNALNIGGLYNSGYSNQIDAHIDEVRVSNIARSISNLQTSTHWEEYNSDANTVLLIHLNDKGDPPTYVSGIGLSGTTGDDDITEDDYVDSRIGYPDYLLRPIYRTQESGNWNTLTNWEVENGVGTYVDATILPGIYSEKITIIDGDTVNVDAAIVSNNLEIESGAQLYVSPSNSLSVEGTLTNSSGTSGLIVEAGSGGNGSLIESNGVSATVEQHLSADAWHLVSSPVSSAQSSIFTDLYLYDWSEADSVFSEITSTSFGLSPTHGFYAWSSSSISSPTDVEFTGTLNTGDKAVSWMTYTAQGYTGGDGWNLTGNPYPSGLAWDNTWSQLNLDATVYVFDAGTSGSWITYNHTTSLGDLTGGEIPSTQGFYVKANAASPSMTIPNSARVHTSNNFYKGSEINEGVFNINITSNENSYSDKLFVGINNEATNNFDCQLDAYKLMGLETAPQLYSFDTESKFTVNLFPSFSGSKSIPLGLRVGVGTEYTINVEGMENFDAGTDVYLQDNASGEMINLKENPIYTFYAEPGLDESRFVLHFNPEFTDVNTSSVTDGINIYAFDKTVFVNYQLQTDGKITIYDISGRILANEPAQQGFNEIKLQVENGYYFVKVISSSNIKTQKIFLK